MFVVRRVWNVLPRQARLAASVALEIASRYEEAGQRPRVRVYFNGGTLPGASDRLYMEWVEETIASTFRPDRVAPEGISELSARLRELTNGSWVEFNELMTPEKAVPIEA
jgi:hypothetical protein